MKAADFIEIGRSLHRIARSDIGRTALEGVVAQEAERIADICAKYPNFDRAAFMDACGLKKT